MTKKVRCAQFATLLLAGALLAPASYAQSKKKDRKKAKTEATTTDSTQTAKKEVPGIKAYNSVITANAVTDDGLFKVHRLNDKYFYEIPDTLLNRDMLLVS